MTAELSIPQASVDALAATGLSDLPLDFFDGVTSRVVYGVAVWWVYHYDECHYDELCVHSHDTRRVLATASAMARAGDVASPKVRLAETGWCRLDTSCGCSPEQHAAHEDSDDCCGVGLPPCDSGAVYAWRLWPVSEGTPGAVPFTRVEVT